MSDMGSAQSPQYASRAGPPYSPSEARLNMPSANEAYPYVEDDRPQKRPRRDSTLDISLASSKLSKGKLIASETSSNSVVILEPATGQNIPTFDWQNDPYQIDGQVTQHYLEMYFVHINATTYCMFPREAFMRWLRTCPNKSCDDRMVMYSMLAMGSIFSPRPERKAHGKHFGNIARFAVEKSHGTFSVQLVQSRLLLALLHFSLGDRTRAWDYCGSALRAVCGLKFNVESGIVDIKDDQIMDYGLTRSALAECHRRTFWSAYLMDVSFSSYSATDWTDSLQRFNGYCSGHLSVIHNSDVYARLPGTEEAYEDQEAVATPYFHNSFVDTRSSLLADPSKVGAMGYLVQISSLWGDVLGNAYRSRHLPSETYPSEYEKFYKDKGCELDEWSDSLPAYLDRHMQNLDQSIRLGYIGTYISLHTLYHAAMMRLGRLAYHRLLPSESIQQKVQVVRQSAWDLLRTTHLLSKLERERRVPEHQLVLSTPFTGYAILTAVDVLSAFGTMPQLKECMTLFNSGLDVVEELASFWSSAKTQMNMIRHRLRDVVSALHNEAHTQHSAMKVAFSTTRAMETTFGPEYDLIYNASWKDRFAAIGCGEASEDKGNVLRIEVSTSEGNTSANGRLG